MYNINNNAIFCFSLSATSLCESQWLLILASVKCFSLLGKRVEIPNLGIRISLNNDQENDDESVKDTTEYKSNY